MIYTDCLDNNELKTLAQSMNSRAKLANCSGQLTLEQLRDCIYSSHGKCEWCRLSLLNQAFEIDHIIPLNRGGGNTADNIALACPQCNRRKSDKHPARFAQETYARTGILSDLLKRVFDHYGVEANKQTSLFDDVPDTPQIDSDDDAPDEPLPYTWG